MAFQVAYDSQKRCRRGGSDSVYIYLYGGWIITSRIQISLAIANTSSLHRSGRRNTLWLPLRIERFSHRRSRDHIVSSATRSKSSLKWVQNSHVHHPQTYLCVPPTNPAMAQLNHKVYKFFLLQLMAKRIRFRVSRLVTQAVNQIRCKRQSTDSMMSF